MATDPEIENLRAEIAQTTKEIIRLAGARNDLARKIGQIKARDSLPSEDQRVEDDLLSEVIKECDAVRLDRSVGLRILSTLLSESKKAQGTQPPSSPMASFAKALALQRKGVKVIRLDVGEPDFRPPKAVLEACSDALFSFKTHYTESRGIPELRTALQDYLKQRRHFEAASDEVTITPSGRFAVFAALSSIVGEGESAIVIEPNWPAYREILAGIGARAAIIHSKLEDGWEVEVEDVEDAIRPNTKALVLGYPNNPTGKIIRPEAFRDIVRLADERGLTVISDEIYNEYAYAPCPSILDAPPRRFVLTASFSKTWAMTGFRIGYAVSSKEMISSMTKVTSMTMTSVPEFIQYGAIRALDASKEVKANVEEMRRRIDAAGKSLSQIERIDFARPDGAMYYFVMLRSYPGGGDAFASKLLDNGVSVTPGSPFGDYQDFFRISLGQPQGTVLEGIEKIGRLLA